MLLERNGKLTMWNSNHNVCHKAWLKVYCYTVYHECEIKVVCQVIDLLAFSTVNWGGHVFLR